MRKVQAGMSGVAAAVDGRGGEASLNRHTAAVRAVYGLASARWYDPFRTAWTWATSRRAEARVDELIEGALRPGSRVLDVGCGTGYNLGRLQCLGVPFATYLGVDLTPAMLAVARTKYADEARAEFVGMDLHDLSAMDERYDLVLCTWVASHLADPRAAFEVAHSRLGPKGRAIFLVMTAPRWSIRWWFAPLARIFRAKVVDPAVFRGLPGETSLTRFTGGLVSLIEMTASEAP